MSRVILAIPIVETSPGNYQDWLAVRGAGEEIERELKEAADADVGANGATRLAGSLNVKEIYRDGGYPVVKLKRLSGRVVSLEVLRAAGLIGTENGPPCVSSSGAQGAPSDAMPDYEEFVGKARRTASGAIDRSAVDFAWAATALKRGFSIEVVCAELKRVSLKAARLSERARGLRQAHSGEGEQEHCVSGLLCGVVGLGWEIESAARVICPGSCEYFNSICVTLQFSRFLSPYRLPRHCQIQIPNGWNHQKSCRDFRARQLS